MAQKSSLKHDAHPKNQAPGGQGAGRASLLTRREGRAAALMVALVIGVIALIPGSSGPPTLIGWDKVDHVAAFAALILLLRCGWPDHHRLIPAAAAFAYGVAIELAQAGAPVGRVASVSDAAANAVGIALGLGVAWGLARVGQALPLLNRRR